MIHGSETATVTEGAGYRVADLAGYLLAERRGEARRGPGPAARDRIIARLREPSHGDGRAARTPLLSAPSMSRPRAGGVLTGEVQRTARRCQQFLVAGLCREAGGAVGALRQGRRSTWSARRYRR